MKKSWLSVATRSEKPGELKNLRCPADAYGRHCRKWQFAVGLTGNAQANPVPSLFKEGQSTIESHKASRVGLRRNSAFRSARNLERDYDIVKTDKDFSLITFNCCQIDLLKLFRGGFSTGHGFLREPNSIRSYASLACIAIQSNQNDMFGGQSINAFDYAMAEGVRKSFRRAIRDEIKRACEFCDVEAAGEVDFNICTYCEGENSAAIENLTKIVGSEKIAEKIYKQACADVVEETHQAMEALIHNFNTLHSRAGAQVKIA